MRAFAFPPSLLDASNASERGCDPHKMEGEKEKKKMRLGPIPSPFTGSSRFHDAVRDFSLGI